MDGQTDMVKSSKVSYLTSILLLTKDYVTLLDQTVMPVFLILAYPNVVQRMCV